MDTLLLDLRLALRSLRRSPLFTTVAVFTLALGIGATGAVFSVVNALLLRPLPYEDADRIVLVGEAKKSEAYVAGTTSYLNFSEWRSQARSFEALALFNGWEPAFTGSGAPERVEGALVTAALFDVLRLRPALGRPILPADNTPASEPVVVVSHAFWRDRLAADPRAVGRTVMLNGTARTVVGVLPAGFRAPGELRGDVWGNNYFDESDGRSSRYLNAIGRLRAGVTLDAARMEMRALAARMEAAYPGDNQGLTVAVTPLREGLVGSTRLPLLVLMGGAATVLLIVCANLSSLLVARGLARTREFAVRSALGARPARMARQLLTESTVLALLGGAAGTLLAVWTTRLLLRSGPEAVREYDIGLHGGALLFCLAATLGAAALFGLVPAVRAARAEPQAALREGGRGSTGGGGERFRSALVVGQLGLALALFAGAGLLLRSFARMQAVDPGIHAEGVLAMSMNLPAAKYPSGTEPALFGRVLDEVRAVPGVQSAAATSILPFGGGFDRVTFNVVGDAARQGADAPEADRYIVTPDYFATLRVPLRSGRLFAAGDGLDAAPVAVVDAELARRIFGGRSPLGRELDLGGAKPVRVVGVVGHVKHYGLDHTSTGQVYLAHAQQPWRWMSLVVRTSGDPLASAPAVRSAVWAVDRDQPVFDITTVARLMDDRAAVRRFATALLAAFAAVALVLAATGLYGTVAFSVARRTREFGVRSALGARPGDLVRPVMRHAAMLSAAGLAAGLAATVAFAGTLRGLLFGVGAADPVTLAAGAATLALVTLLASWLPARRAARVDPMEALRSE